jgi:ABC-type bacteriocin/lantibiotic exporter with double-glycine peptidase domain
MVTLIAGLIVAFVNGWKLSLVVVACLPVMGIGAYYQAKIQIGSASKVRTGNEKNKTETKVEVKWNRMSLFIPPCCNQDMPGPVLMPLV